MLRSIMVVADGGAPFQGAMTLAVRWGRRFNALVVGTGIVDQRIAGPAAVPLGAGAAKVDRDEDIIGRYRQKVHDGLDLLDTRCQEAGVSHQTVQTNGRTYEDVLEHAQRYDVVLMSQPVEHDAGVGGLQHDQLEEVLRSTPRPVISVPENLSDERRGILVAYDGSLQAARATQALVATGLIDRGQATIVSIDSESADTARSVADRARDYLQLHGIEATVKPIQAEERVSEVLLNEISEQEPELLVMGAYGQSRFKEFFLGSVTSDLLRQASIPVFLFH